MKFIEKLAFFVNKLLLRRYWKAHNQHNATWLGEICNRQFVEFIRNGGISVGKYTYGKLNVNYTCNVKEKLTIGNYCSISTSCLFILGGEHDYRTISTYPIISKIGGYETEVLTKGEIYLEDEVWIGDRAIIMSGVSIGKGAVIAAGSVVTHNVPPYAIVAGNPARVIKYRFSDAVIKQLMQYKLIVSNVDSNIKEILLTRINDENIQSIIERLEKMNVIERVRFS